MKHVTNQFDTACFSRTDPDVRKAVAPAGQAAKPVLLALSEQGHPTATLLRASALARTLDADLHVLRVLPERTRLNALFPQRNVAGTVETVEHTLRAYHSTRSWLRDWLDDAIADDQLAIAHGGFVEQLAAHAAGIEAQLIVVPPLDGRFGKIITSLVSTAAVPVLVARSPTGDETILAATDLANAGLPVLRTAAALGLQLDAPVVALHNVAPVVVFAGLQGAHAVAPHGASLTAARRERLTRASEWMPVETEPVVRLDIDTVDAILDEARAHDADMVVVGARPRSWLDRLLGASVADRIVDRARRSVLVTPIDSDDVEGAATFACA